MAVGRVALDWQTRVVVLLFKKGDQRVCSNYWGITLLSLPGKVYFRVLERRIQPIVKPWIQEEQCSFCPGRGTLDQLYTLRRVLEGSWEFAQPVHMCFVDLEKVFDYVPCGILWEVLQEYGVGGPPLRAVRSLYNRFALPTVSQTCYPCTLDSARAALCHRFCSLFLRTEFLGAATG